MKAITILQPHASLIALQQKKYETRSWATKYRGPIAIHAGQSWTLDRRKLTYREPFCSVLWTTLAKKELSPYERTKRLPVGAVIAIAELVDCSEVIACTLDNLNSGHTLLDATLKNGQVVTGDELVFGDFTLGRYAWQIENVKSVKPIAVKGRQRLWEWDECDAIEFMQNIVNHDGGKEKE